MHKFSSRVPTPRAQVPNAPPKERRRSVMPIPAEVVSIARDATGLPPPSQPRSAKKPAGGAFEAPGRSAIAIRPACTALEARPSTNHRRVPHLKSRRDSARVPPVPRQYFPACPITARATSPSSFSALLSAQNRAAGRRPSYSVLAMCSVTRRSGRPGASVAVRPGLLSSTARRGTAADGTSCPAGGTPTKLGRARWVRCAHAGAARKPSKNA
ncbi:hypothetical protein EDB86DRAFT_2953884, partial [Lactarius hatsudake]